MSLRSLFAEVLRASEQTQTGGRPAANRPFIGANMLDIPMKHDESKPDGLFSEAHAPEARRARAWLRDRLEKSKKLHAGELLTETVWITPVMAEVILSECNQGNRPVRSGRVRAYAEDMREGRWRFTSQGISFSDDGLLNNGQNRLHAVIEAGCPAQIHVAFGEPRNAFYVLDTQGTRGGSDTLHIKGHKNTTTLAGAARLLQIILSGAPGRNKSFSNTVIADIVEEHSPGLEAATTPGQKVGRKLGISKSAVTAALYLIAANSDHSRRLDFFIDRMCDGAGLRARDPVLTLRDGFQKKDEMLNGGVKGTGQRAIVHAAVIIKAWNKWVHGKTAAVNQLSWAFDEPFPTPE